MRSPIYWIDIPVPGRLGIMARPRAGDWLDDEIASWEAAGVTVVVCLLEENEIDELGLGDEESFRQRRGIEFVSFPIPDRGHPKAIGQTAALTQTTAMKLKEGATVAIHCRAGIGRSSLIAACTLIGFGLDVDSAFDMIAKARGLKVPDTDEQRSWAISFEDAIS
jgi:protein-tyrosine phosphatase